jgi:hypothetical protein
MHDSSAHKPSALGALGKRAVAWLVLIAAVVVALKVIAGVVIGLVTTVLMVALVVAVVVGGLWALRHL